MTSSNEPQKKKKNPASKLSRYREKKKWSIAFLAILDI